MNTSVLRRIATVSCYNKVAARAVSTQLNTKKEDLKHKIVLGAGQQRYNRLSVPLRKQTISKAIARDSLRELPSDEIIELVRRKVPSFSSSWVEPVHDDAFLRKKYMYLFRIYDVNKDNLFTLEDLKAFQKAVIIEAELTGERKERFLENSYRYLTSILGEPKSAISPRLTARNFVDNLINKRKNHPLELCMEASHTAALLWETVDFHADNSVNKESFKTLMATQLIRDPSVVELLFSYMDSDGNQILDLGELVQSHLDFVMNEKPDIVSMLKLGGCID